MNQSVIDGFGTLIYVYESLNWSWYSCLLIIFIRTPITNPAKIAVPAVIKKPTICQPPCWIAVRVFNIFKVCYPFAETRQAWTIAETIQAKKEGTK